MGLRALVAQERADLVSFLRTLSEEEWNSPSLCAGWRVRDVVAHLCYDTVPLPTYLQVAARYGFSADRVNAHWVTQAEGSSPKTLTDKLADLAGRGPMATLVPSIVLADTVVHHQDIRRPLGRERVIPADRLISVLKHPDPFARPGSRSRGLRFVATDVAWSHGQGPEVCGPGEAIALAVVGRPAALDELTGEGAELLRTRITRCH